jgi:hypothetical protein
MLRAGAAEFDHTPGTAFHVDRADWPILLRGSSMRKLK